MKSILKSILKSKFFLLFIILLLIIISLFIYLYYQKEKFINNNEINNNEINNNEINNNIIIKNKKIIHISGASGSGKTTLGDKLNVFIKNNDKFKTIIIKDLDDLFNLFMKYKNYKLFQKFNTSEYQEYIDTFIKNTNKHIIFVGLNIDLTHKTDYYYTIPADFKYYIDENIKIIYERKCIRLIDIIVKDKDKIKRNLKNSIINNNQKQVSSYFNELVNFECNYDDIIEKTNEWNEYYKKQNYIFLPFNELLETVKKNIENL
jgi:energy-coupling factor transporter ATP-binding protein EcfA2